MAIAKAFLVIVGYLGFLGLVVFCLYNTSVDDLTRNRYEDE